MAKSRALSLAFWFSVGVRRRPAGWLRFVIPPLAVALAIYVIVAATVLIIALYVPVAGAGPSIQRAGAMGAAAILATLAPDLLQR